MKAPSRETTTYPGSLFQELIIFTIKLMHLIPCFDLLDFSFWLLLILPFSTIKH